MQKSNNYAANQVKFFLSELKNGTHTAKLKAIQRFQGYIERYQPEIYDDTVHFLFTGEDEIAGVSTLGLLHFCGLESEKQPGQLKRSSGPLLSLLCWLVHQTDDIYLNNFVRLSTEHLSKINFPKHILNNNESSKLVLNIGRQTKRNRAEEAFELLLILYQDHRNAEDEQDPIDLNFLLQSDQVCIDRFHSWLQKSNLDYLEEELANRVRQPRQKVIPRPSRWDDVNLKPIPLQEGEDEGIAAVDEGPSAPPPIPDPLSLRDVDLRETQEIYATGGLQKRMIAARRATEIGLPSGRNRSVYNMRDSVIGGSGALVVDEDEDDFEDDHSVPGRRGIQSVIPSDKAFSISLFLSLVHGGTSFEELGTGLTNLRVHLKEQSTRRVNLVRNHFGLFSQCAEGLEWLKEYRKGNLRIEEVPGRERNYRKERDAMRKGSLAGKTSIVRGMEELRRAQGTLELAKVEAKNTLAPILERMKKAREIKSAEKVLKGMSSLLDFPRSMKSALERGELRDVVSLYQRVHGIPESTSLKIVSKIKRAAESVVVELKKTSLAAVMTPSVDPAPLLRHSQILMDLEGAQSYLRVLRLSFLRQLGECIKSLHDIRERLVRDCSESVDKGQELSIAAKNSTLGAEYNLVADLQDTARRFMDSSSLSGTSSMRLIMRSNSVSSRPRLASNTSTSSLPFQRKSFYEPNSTGVNGIMPINDTPHEGEEAGGKRSSEWIDGVFSQRSLENSLSDLDLLITPSETSDIRNSNSLRDFNFGEFLSHVARKVCTERLIDLIATWFPCLFRLSTEIMTFDPSSRDKTANTLHNKSGNSLFSSAFTKGANMKASSLTSPSRLLGVFLSLATDLLLQCVHGMKPSLASLSWPVEIQSAMTELEQDWIGLQSSLGLPLPPKGQGLFNLDNTQYSPSGTRFADIISMSLFYSSISMQHEVLLDVFKLHEALEVAFTNAAGTVRSIVSQTTGQSFPIPREGGRNLPLPGIFGKKQAKYGNQLSAVLQDLDCHSPLSPFHDSMRVLEQMARESEASVTQIVLDRIHDRSLHVCETLLFETDSDKISNVLLQSKLSLSSDVIGVEAAVQEFESLLLSGLISLTEISRRPDWTAGLVKDMFFQRIFSGLQEKIRRKVMVIEDLRSSSSNQGSMVGQTSPPRKLQRRNSLTQDNIILASLEDDLRMSDVGWEREHLSLKTTKCSALIDLLRGLLRLRGYTLPTVLGVMLKTFQFDDQDEGQLREDLPDSSLPAASPPVSSGKDSVLNRLFVVESAAEVRDQSNSRTKQKKLESPADASAPFSKKGDLTDQISSQVEEQLLQSGSPLTADAMKGLSQQLRQLLQDLETLEGDVVEQYLRHRSNGIKTLLFAAYGRLADSETRRVTSLSDYGLPDHLSRILLALHEEKTSLSLKMGALSVDNKTNTKVFLHMLDSLDVSQIVPADGKKDKKKAHTAVASNRYSTVLYQQLGHRLLSIYEELLTHLKAEQNAPDIRTPITGSTSERLRAQALEEFEFFKIVLRPVLIELQRKMAAEHDFQQVAHRYKILSCQDLLQAGQLLTLLVQQI